MAVKDRLKEARIKNGLTQEELGVMIGVAKPTIAGYEKGSREPDMNRLNKLMSALSVDANYLFQDEMAEALTVNDTTPADDEIRDEDIQFAAYDGSGWDDLTEEEKQSVRDYIKFKMSQRNK